MNSLFIFFQSYFRNYCLNKKKEELIHFFFKFIGTNKISHVLQNVHDGTVFTICALPDGQFLSGGKDRNIIKWDVNYKKVTSSKIEEAFGAVRMLTCEKGPQIIVGTTKNNILMGSFELQWSPIVFGHVEELWGLAVHPTQHQFLTAGEDKVYRKYCTYSLIRFSDCFFFFINFSYSYTAKHTLLFNFRIFSYGMLISMRSFGKNVLLKVLILLFFIPMEISWLLV